MKQKIKPVSIFSNRRSIFLLGKVGIRRRFFANPSVQTWAETVSQIINLTLITNYRLTHWGVDYYSYLCLSGLAIGSSTNLESYRDIVAAHVLINQKTTPRCIIHSNVCAFLTQDGYRETSSAVHVAGQEKTAEGDTRGRRGRRGGGQLFWC